MAHVCAEASGPAAKLLRSTVAAVPIGSMGTRIINAMNTCVSSPNRTRGTLSFIHRAPKRSVCLCNAALCSVIRQWGPPASFRTPGLCKNVARGCHGHGRIGGARPAPPVGVPGKCPPVVGLRCGPCSATCAHTFDEGLLGCHGRVGASSCPRAQRVGKLECATEHHKAGSAAPAQGSAREKRPTPSIMHGI